MALRPKRSIIIISVIAICVVVFTMCIDKQSEEPAQMEPVRKSFEARETDYAEFAGSSTCRSCHGDITKNHRQTSHYNTSKPATEKNIKGSFKKGKNTFTYNPDLYIEMEKSDSGLYQVVYYKGEKKIALKFGLTVGSGTKGQSFVHWQDNRMFQMPLTYYAIEGRWANSPGFPNKVQYERPITARCMECHTTYSKVLSPPKIEPEQFDPGKIIFGVDCEKCHGPAANHVKFQTEHPNVKEGKFIVNPAKLTRQQNLDLCALCHGGRLERKQPSFTYAVGDTLADYFVTDALNKSGRNYATVDVHGNQYGLMSASKCFIKSNTLTCNTCHNTHENERGKAALFSSRCQGCHTGEHKKTGDLASIPASVIKSNCIDCHMASEPSHSIVLFTSGMEKPRAAMFRSHFITVYPQETQKFIDSLKKMGNR